MAKSNNKGPRIVSKPHPRGESGTKISLSEIVKRVEQGRMDPKTRAWSLETIQRGNLGGFGADKMMQAQAILERLRKERPYVEDPVDGEFMQSSACTLDGCDGLTFLGGDCDDLVIAFLSAVESVGIEGALVAHSYESHRQHTHVLSAVRDEKRNTWVRCDPSTSDPFGTVSKPTRETFVGIPGGKILADNQGPVNVSKVGSALGKIRPTGDFVGVGKPFGLLGAVPNQAEPVFGDVSDAFYLYMVQEVIRITDLLDKAWMELKFKHEQLRLVAGMMNELAGGGYELVEPEVVNTGDGSKLPAWTAKFEAYYQSLAQWVPVMISYGNDVRKGDRKIAWDEESETVVILGRPGEPFVGMDDDKKIFVVTTTPPDEGSLGGPDGSVGLHPAVLIGLLVVGSVIQYLMVREACVTLNNYIDASKAKRDQQWLKDMSGKYGIEKAQELYKEQNRAAEEKAKVEVEKDKVSPFTKIAETADTALNALMVIAIGGAVVYGIAAAVDWSKSRKSSS